MTTRTTTPLRHAIVVLLVALALPAQAAEIVVVGSPSDNSSPTAMAIVASVRAIVLDHPWLGLAEIDNALASPGHDSREPLKRATRDWREARAKFDDLLLDEAAKLVQSAVNGYRDHLAQSSNLRPLQRALELWGAVALARNDIKAATEAIEEVIALNPDAIPNPEIFNPPMAKRWAQIAARFKAGPKNTLVIEAPPGEPAVVEIDGHYRGLAPLTAKDMLMGNHYVRVSRAGAVPWGQRIDIGKKPVRLAPQLTQLREAGPFVDARAMVWDANAETRKRGMRELGKTLHVEYIVLVSTTPRDTVGAPALTPVHAELYSVSKDRVLRSADAALGVRPGSAPPLARTFIDALLPAAPRAVLSGTQSVLGEPDGVSAAKREVALAVRAVQQAEVRENVQVDDTCLVDALCMAKVQGDADSVLLARVTPTGRDATVDVVSYVGNHQAGQISVDRARTNDEPLLLAIAELTSLTYLELEDRRLAGDIIRTVPTTQATQLDLAMSVSEKRKGRRTVGLITAGAGAAVAIGGFVLAGLQAKVLDDPGSSGDAKSSARSLGRAGIISGGVGAAALITGGIIWFLNRDPGDVAEP